METQTQDVLSPEHALNLVPAGTGKRFVNFLIDTIAFYFLFFILAMVFFASDPDAAERYASDPDAGNSLLENVIGLLLFLIYYFATEALFKGKSIGKFVTATRAVYENDGGTISTKTALTRSLSRLVPFETISILFGRPWHDSWTDTIVIDEKQSTTIK